MLLLCTGASTASAEPAPTSTDAEPPAKPRAWGIVPLPVISYAPETELLFGAMLGGYVKPETPKGHETSFLTFAALSTKAQLLLGGGVEAYLAHDQVLLGLELQIRRFPDTFYGIGNDTRLTSAEDLSSDDLIYELRPMVRVVEHFYVGVVKHAWFSRVRDREPGGILDSGAIEGSTGGRSMSTGVAATFDSRDNTINATSGVLVAGRLLTAKRELGSQFDFEYYTLDARTYLSPAEGHVIAFDVLGEARGGDPPFYQLALLGGRNKLRGIYEGRYRDNWLALAQTEYRFPIVGILGGVAFGGVGDVASKPADFLAHGLKYSVGGGLRLLLDRVGRVNAAVDFGYAGDQSGLYIGLGEVF